MTIKTILIFKQDKRLLCTEDRDFQSSTNVLQAHWTIPTGKEHFLHDIHWAIEERAPIASNKNFNTFLRYDFIDTTLFRALSRI
jgi:hypothetical protein